MRNTRNSLLSLAATFALSLATLLPAAPARADHEGYRGHGHGYGYGHEVHEQRRSPTGERGGGSGGSAVNRQLTGRALV